MIIAEVQERLRKAFDPATDRPMLRAVMEGILIADDIFNGNPFLNNEVGHDLRGHIRRVGVMHRIRDYCNREYLPFRAEMRQMPRGTWHWLEIQSADVLAHVCRTEDANAFPVDTPNRQDARLTNQPDLLSWHPGVIPFRPASVRQLYAWMMMRATSDGRLTHLCWGCPAATNDEWLAHIDVLNEISCAEGSPPSRPPVPDPKDRLRFKEEIVEALGSKKNNERTDE